MKYAIGYKDKILCADGEFHFVMTEHDDEMLFDTEEEAELNFPHGGCYAVQV